MVCKVCTRLSAELALRQEQYVQAIRIFALATESTDTAHYCAVRSSTEEARIDRELARLELGAHEQVHLKAN